MFGDALMLVWLHLLPGVGAHVHAFRSLDGRMMLTDALTQRKDGLLEATALPMRMPKAAIERGHHVIRMAFDGAMLLIARGTEAPQN